jgi:hypothetical protein
MILKIISPHPLNCLKPIDTEDVSVFVDVFVEALWGELAQIEGWLGELDDEGEMRGELRCPELLENLQEERVTLVFAGAV